MTVLTVGGIEWRTFAAMQAAVAEAARTKKRVEGCTMWVVQTDATYTVSFGNESPRNFLGCAPGPCSCFRVELSRSDLRVLDSGLVK